MKIGIRISSFSKRIAARTSVRRALQNGLGLKAPGGMGWLTNPKRAAYNRTTTGCGFIFVLGFVLRMIIIRPGS